MATLLLRWYFTSRDKLMLDNSSSKLRHYNENNINPTKVVRNDIAMMLPIK